MEFCFSELPVDGTDWIERTSLTLTSSFSFLPSAVSFVHHQKRLHFTMSKGLFPKRLLAARHQLSISVRELCPAGSPAACALRNKLWIERGLSTRWSPGEVVPLAPAGCWSCLSRPHSAAYAVLASRTF